MQHIPKNRVRLYACSGWHNVETQCQVNIFLFINRIYRFNSIHFTFAWGFAFDIAIEPVNDSCIRANNWAEITQLEKCKQIFVFPLSSWFILSLICLLVSNSKLFSLNSSLADINEKLKHGHRHSFVFINKPKREKTCWVNFLIYLYSFFSVKFYFVFSSSCG